MKLRNLLAILSALCATLPVHATVMLCACAAAEEAPASAPAKACCCGMAHDGPCAMEKGSAEAVRAPKDSVEQMPVNCLGMADSAPIARDAENATVTVVFAPNSPLPLLASPPIAPSCFLTPPPTGGPPVFLLACAFRC
jgi:hypothetical protein